MRGILLVALSAVSDAARRADAPMPHVMDTGSLVAAIRTGDLTAPVDGVISANRIFVVSVSELAGIRVDFDRLARVIEWRQSALRYFREAIGVSKWVRSALDAHDYGLDRVIYATFTNNRTATLYVDDR